MQRHLGGKEVGCSHPGLDSSEVMLNRLAPQTHLFRMFVEPAPPREVVRAPIG
jgi:hypothetical protein